ncbi:MAG TPA: hypothetical protein VN541_07470 [Tepidisphaeraceae bacterium]|nr:hypothetical protein [Tepidisphaeraceae bacterium]
MMWRRFTLPVLVLLLTAWSAQARAGQAQAQASSPDFSHTWLLHLPGIGGERSIDHHMIDGLTDGGWDGPITIYDWTEKDPGLDALLAYKRNQEEAAKVAKLIEKRLEKDPFLKITLTAHSGGTGIAVWALERLPDKVQIQTLVLLASALSPGYDLSRALSHVHGKAFVFYSKNDQLVLGAGTRLFGTIDGVKSDSAGLVSFHMPPDADKAEYEKLDQKPYDRSWIAFSNIGNHVGCMSRPFACNVLAPLLIDNLSSVGPTTRPAEHDTQTAKTDGPVNAAAGAKQ